jgi:hypothetical protein
MDESHEASHDPLYPFYDLNWTYPSDGHNLLWVGFDATRRDDELEQHTSWDPEDAFFRVEFYAILSEFIESFIKVGHELVGLLGLDYNVIHVCLDGLSDEIAETFKHTSLVCCSCILQIEWHANVTLQFEWRDKRSHELVRLFHHNLIVARVRIKEAEGFAP